jgi:ssDNA-binding Zn-finger/Zn-ribbon topoisomerase 1
MTLGIKCPQCGKAATVNLKSSGAANDNPDAITFEAPPGFRKVQVGWNSETLVLFCEDCGVAAKIVSRR